MRNFHPRHECYQRQKSSMSLRNASHNPTKWLCTLQVPAFGAFIFDMSGTKKIDPQRRAVFKETARRIIGEDRDARKYGRSQNTIGAIERAMVAAFLEGKAVGTGDLPDDLGDQLTWEQLPPRCRETLSSMSISFSHLVGRPNALPSQIQCIVDGGRRRWRIMSEDGYQSESTAADGSVQPLVKRGLLIPTANDETVFQLTAQAEALCRDHWRRSDEGDTTLPRMSFR